MEKAEPVLNEKGQYVIRGSRRPDGTYRKDIVVKEGYVVILKPINYFFCLILLNLYFTL
jgi:hypothetical protein